MRGGFDIDGLRSEIGVIPDAPAKRWRFLNILHIIGSLSPDGGGPPEAVRQLVKAYVEVGVEIEVVCLDEPDSPYLADVSCRVHALGQSLLGRYAFSPRLWRWLHGNVHRFDALVINGIWTFPGVATRSAARKTKIPYGVFVHGALDPWFNKTYPLKHLKKNFYWPIQRAVLHDAEVVFFTTDAERDLAMQSFRKSEWNSMVVPYGINDPEDAHPNHAEQIQAFYDAMPQLRGRRFLLFLARIHEKKGCDLLIEAFAKVAALAPDVDLVVAGPDQVGLQSKLQHLAAEHGIGKRVHWPGFLGGDLKWGAMRACDAFVLPSHQENFGIAVVEALAVGRPVLISNQVNIWQDIEADKVGLVDEDTPEGIERLLLQWFDLPRQERNAMAARARPSFVRRYGMYRAAQAISHLFAATKAEAKTAAV